jgi:hypothetical protein
MAVAGIPEFLQANLEYPNREEDDRDEDREEQDEHPSR